MDKTKLIDVHDLQERAKSSEHKESCEVLERSHSYRVAVGARLAFSMKPSFFLEVVIHLCAGSSGADLTLLEKCLMFLRELQARGYSLNCHDEGCISCEITLQPQNLAAEYRTIKSITERIFF